MNKFYIEIYRQLRVLLGNPESAAQTVTVLALSVFICALVFQKLNSVLETPLSGMGRSVLVLVIAAVILLAASVSAKLYIVPELTWAGTSVIVPVITVAAFLFLIVIPLGCFIQKTKYFRALFCLALSVGAAGAVILLVNASFSAVRVTFSRCREASGRTENILNDAY